MEESKFFLEENHKIERFYEGFQSWKVGIDAKLELSHIMIDQFPGR
jgi:hypothetical protein